MTSTEAFVKEAALKAGVFEYAEDFDQWLTEVKDEAFEKGYDGGYQDGYDVGDQPSGDDWIYDQTYGDCTE